MSHSVVEPADVHLEYQKCICETKHKFKSREDARIAALRRVAKDAALKALYAYKCAACDQVHLTKKKTRVLLAAKGTP